ncbi:hypothetical protein DIPPA_34594 [Diplonema papillatum]|nr:hypothetical protein DIPPA_34594 [Diplonema papillatum]
MPARGSLGKRDDAGATPPAKMRAKPKRLPAGIDPGLMDHDTEVEAALSTERVMTRRDGGHEAGGSGRSSPAPAEPADLLPGRCWDFSRATPPPAEANLAPDEAAAFAPLENGCGRNGDGLVSSYITAANMPASRPDPVRRLSTLVTDETMQAAEPSSDDSDGTDEEGFNRFNLAALTPSHAFAAEGGGEENDLMLDFLKDVPRAPAADVSFPAFESFAGGIDSIGTDDLQAPPSARPKPRVFRKVPPKPAPPSEPKSEANGAEAVPLAAPPPSLKPGPWESLTVVPSPAKEPPLSQGLKPGSWESLTVASSPAKDDLTNIMTSPGMEHTFNTSIQHWVDSVDALPPSPVVLPFQNLAPLAHTPDEDSEPSSPAPSQHQQQPQHASARPQPPPRKKPKLAPKRSAAERPKPRTQPSQQQSPPPQHPRKRQQPGPAKADREKEKAREKGGKDKDKEKEKEKEKDKGKEKEDAKRDRDRAAAEERERARRRALDVRLEKAARVDRQLALFTLRDRGRTDAFLSSAFPAVVPAAPRGIAAHLDAVYLYPGVFWTDCKNVATASLATRLLQLFRWLVAVCPLAGYLSRPPARVALIKALHSHQDVSLVLSAAVDLAAKAKGEAWSPEEAGFVAYCAQKVNS